MGLPAAIRVQQMKDVHKTAVVIPPLRRNHGPGIMRCHYSEPVYGGVSERKKKDGSSPMRRGRSEETRVARLMYVACLPLGVMWISGPGLLPRATSGSVVLPRSLLMSMTPVITKGHENAWVTTNATLVPKGHATSGAAPI